MRRRTTPRRRGGHYAALLTVIAAVGTALFIVPSAFAGAAYTTDNPGVTDACLNGNPGHTTPGVNCNIYDAKEDVWINGGPSQGQNELTPGTYFFAVLEPGGQPDPNDGGAKNLSDEDPAGGIDDSPGDPYTNRIFTVGANGHITSTAGDHLTDNTYSSTLGTLIQLWPYDTTSNPGGVYILAICELNGDDPVDPSLCKYDAFKVKKAGGERAAGPTVVKDATGAYDNSFVWDITKDVDKTRVEQLGGTATFEYTVTVHHDEGTVSGVSVSGTITVFNPNVDASDVTVPITGVDVTDELSDGTACAITGGSANGVGETLSDPETEFAYECDLGDTLPTPPLDNTVTVEWPAQTLADDRALAGGTDDFTFHNISFAENQIDECVTVTDTVLPSGGTSSDNPFPTTVCVGDSGDVGGTFTFVYHRTFNVPASGCVSYTNTGAFTTNDTQTPGSDNETVTVCGPADTGARTIGFWKTTNGQNLINTYCIKNGYNLGTYLKGLGAGFGPFSNAPTTCGALKTYVFNILNGASATNMNVMLKAQMLGTALDVWFSGPGWRSTKLNGIKPPSNFLSHNNLGTFNMNTRAVCPMVDNLSTGSAVCKSLKPSTDAVAAGAVPTSPMAMQAILDFAATIDPATPPWDVGAYNGANVWYFNTTTGLQDRTKQEILKNIFDQFNNELAFGSF
jgi:hypothetical protein